MNTNNELQILDENFENLDNKNNKIRCNAFQTLLQLTDNKVDWVYDKWFELIDMLQSKNAFHRSIGLLLLANLSKSDTENRISSILDDYLIFFDDEKFITSRQCIQNVWKIAIANSGNTTKIINNLEHTFYENRHINTHGNLIKQDVISSLYQIYKHQQGNELIDKINKLIQSETDDKIKKSLIKIIKK